jgi:hypothetical protein
MVLWGYDWTAEVSGFDFLKGQEISLLSAVSRPALGPIYSMGDGGAFLGVKLTTSLSLVTVSQNAWSYSPS